MERIILKGISQKGRNRIHELGDEWLVLLYRDQVSFSPIHQPGGGWLLLAPFSNTEKVRWIQRNGDPDFEILASEILSS